jgi:hypothetical protein
VGYLERTDAVDGLGVEVPLAYIDDKAGSTPSKSVPSESSGTRTKLECCFLGGLFRVALSGWRKITGQYRVLRLAPNCDG